MEKDFVKTTTEMAVNINAHINEMFMEDECNYFIEVTTENATEFFTALHIVCCNKLINTGMCKNLIQAHNLYNELLVAYLLKSNDKNV